MDELADTDWRREGESIVRDPKFDDFAAGGLTDSDFQMAKKVDALG